MRIFLKPKRMKLVQKRKTIELGNTFLNSLGLDFRP